MSFVNKEKKKKTTGDSSIVETRARGTASRCMHQLLCVTSLVEIRNRLRYLEPWGALILEASLRVRMHLFWTRKSRTMIDRMPGAAQSLFPGARSPARQTGAGGILLQL